MPLNPPGATLILSGSASATVIVDSISYSYAFEPFDRLEYDNTRLREAPTDLGVKRVLGELLGRTPFQITFNCVDDTQVPLVPNSDATFDNVKKRFNITRFTINGALSAESDVEALATVAADHNHRLAKFQAYLQRSSGDTSYEELIALQSEAFTYLTTSGLTFSGTCLPSSVNNVLITSMTGEYLLSIPNGSGNDFYQGFSITAEVRTISNLSAS